MFTGCVYGKTKSDQADDKLGFRHNSFTSECVHYTSYSPLILKYAPLSSKIRWRSLWHHLLGANTYGARVNRAMTRRRAHHVNWPISNQRNARFFKNWFVIRSAYMKSFRNACSQVMLHTQLFTKRNGEVAHKCKIIFNSNRNNKKHPMSKNFGINQFSNQFEMLFSRAYRRS